MEHCWEVGITDSIAAFGSFRFSPWRYFGFKINVASCSTFGVRPLLSTEQTVVSPRMLSVVVNTVRCSEPVVHNHRLLCWRRQSRTGKQASFCCAKFLFFKMLCWLKINNYSFIFVCSGQLSLLPSAERKMSSSSPIVGYGAKA